MKKSAHAHSTMIENGLFRARIARKEFGKWGENSFFYTMYN